jgi:dihydroorotate dehydrogenase (fumarate)
MNLAAEYLGLRLTSPLIVGASPFCDHVDDALRLQEAGAGAVVMRSLFEEQLEPPGPQAFRPEDTASLPPAFPEPADYQFQPTAYLRQLDALKSALSIPVIASLNGHHPGSWTEFAPRLEAAGADAIELNFYQVVASPSLAADQVEREMIETIGLVAGAVEIPVAAKLSPFHASVAQLAVAAELAGAAGLVLFNRFYQPDIDLTTLAVQPRLQLSDSNELLLRLRWLAILAPQLRGSLAASGGVHTWGDAAKAILTGAHAVQLVSAPLRHGAEILRIIGDGLAGWMKGHGFSRLDQFRGLLDLRHCAEPSAFERANYLRTLQSWEP